MAAKTGKNSKAPKDETKPEAKQDTKPEGKAADKEKPVKKELVTVKTGALSVDVGPRVIAGLSEAFVKEDQANAILNEVNRRRFDLLAETTAAIVKAAKADDSINLAAAVGDDKKAMNVLNDQLGLALGFREIVTIPGKKGEEDTKVIQTAKSVVKFFPSKNDVKGSEAAQRKATLRTNFLHMLKKCAQASVAIMEKDIVIKPDKATGTLRISGPAVMERYGQSEVLLDGKLSMGEGDSKVTLKEKPSFQGLAKLGAETQGKVVEARKDSRASATAVDAQTALQSICSTLVERINKLKDKPNPETTKQLNAVKSAVDKLLADNK
jgi:ribosome-associated translation inhibitor RaiA